MSVTMNHSNNYVNDVDSYMNIITKICNKLEEYALQNKDERAKLYKQLAEHLAQGGRADFTMVDRDIYAKVEARLREAQIPYVPLNNPATNYVGIAIRDIDRDKFKEILDDILLQDGKYNTQIQIDKEFDLARKSGDKEIAVLRTRQPYTALDFEVFKDVLNKNNIVCGAEDFNIKGEYSSMTAVLQENLFKAKGADLASSMLEAYVRDMANFKAANFDKDNSYQHYKQAYLQYRHNMIKDFTVKVREGKPAILLDTDKRDIYIKFRNQELEVFKKNEKGEWDLVQATTLEKNGKNRTSEDEVKKMRSIIAKFTPQMGDKMFVVENEAIPREPDNSNAIKILQQDRYCIEKGGKVGVTFEELFCNSMDAAKKSNKSKQMDKIQEHLLTNVIPQVDKLAHQRATKVVGFSTMSPQEKNSTVCVQVEAILKNADCDAIQSFLNDETLDVEGIDKRALLNELAYAFVYDNAITLDVMKIRDAELELQECRENDDDYKVRYEAEKEQEQEEEEERDFGEE